MLNKFNKDLSVQEIWAMGSELSSIMGLDRDSDGDRVYSHPDTERVRVAEFRNPFLVTDEFKIGQLQPRLRTTVFSLFQSPIRHTEYDGTELAFEEGFYDGLWGPSIDTLLICKALEKPFINYNAVRRIVEVGSGSGFITKRLIEKIPHLETATIVDINPNAETCLRDNLSDNLQDKVDAQIMTAQDFFGGEFEQYDLMICNPPYVPRPHSIDDNPYEGTGLMKYLIEHSRRILNTPGMFVCNFSSLCDKEALPLAQEYSSGIRSMAHMDVPLKIPNVYNSPGWVDFLVEEGRVQEKLQHGYDLWQSLHVKALFPK